MQMILSYEEAVRVVSETELQQARRTAIHTRQPQTVDGKLLVTFLRGDELSHEFSYMLIEL